MPIQDLVETLIVIAFAAFGTYATMFHLLPWLHGEGARPADSVPAQQITERVRAENEGP